MKPLRGIFFLMALFLVMAPFSYADLDQIKATGELRHLGVPYANFVTGDGEGLDARIIKLYCDRIGVKYRYVKTNWDSVISDLSGKKFKVKGDEVEIIGETPVRGDIIGNGLTFIPWRQKIINYSIPYFPSAIWVIAKADSALKPILPTSDQAKDVEMTRDLLRGKDVLGIKNTCVDLDLYNLPEARPVYKEGITLNDLAAALVKGAAEVSILDVPDSLIALSKFPGKIKILGSITGKQDMGFGFSKDSPKLLESFNQFLVELKSSGELTNLILKYYPGIDRYFPEVLKRDNKTQ